MNHNKSETPADLQKRTEDFLRQANKKLQVYAKAMGTMVCVLDKDFRPIPESYNDFNYVSNTCLHCVRYKEYNKNKKPGELRETPCEDMHSNAILGAHRYGGSYIYMCDLGFLFWSSPLYFEGNFSGSLLGTGFLGTDSDDTVEKMYHIVKGSITVPELRRMLSRYPRGESKKIQGLAKMLLFCAESFSSDSGAYHETLCRQAKQQDDISEKIELLKKKNPSGSFGAEYPLEKERQIITALRQGDRENANEFLNEFLAILFISHIDQFPYLNFRAMELVVLLSRTVIGPGYDARALLKTNKYFFKLIWESKNIKDLADVLHFALNHFAEQISSFKGIQHASAIKKTERYIWENLSRKLSLKEIAAVSGLSGPYFSTIFKEEMGENVSCYINRLRVERACALLTETDMTLSMIADSCGFEDQSWFTKVFRTYTGISPGRYRNRIKSPNAEGPYVSFSPKYRAIVAKLA
ncbi:MAG: helix-turn-helix domain-containing protein [Treponema sp.]|jgi:AraC-like DNA-binding protein/ligand-binding sensor protein|nr:helix-turn-helix domain-containing protein [Treponema sp.]